MGFIGFLVRNLDKDIMYYLGKKMIDYNMINIRSTYYTLYYSLTFAWHFRDKVYNEIFELFQQPKLLTYSKS